MDHALPESLSGLDDNKHLFRERALLALGRMLEAGAWTQQGVAAKLQQRVMELVDSPSWEGRQGGFLAAKTLVPYHDTDSPFLERLLTECENHLEDEEARVRLAVAELLRQLATSCGASVYLRLQRRLVQSIEMNFERDPEEAEEGGEGSQSPRSLRSDTSIGLVWNKRTGLRAANPLASTVQGPADEMGWEGRGANTLSQHDTEGWKCLETSFKALQCLIEGTGEAIAEHLGSDERTLIYRALQHPNRFVRETGFLTMSSLCGILRGANLLPQLDEMALWLAKGLGDNWSQVRFAASVATRAFLEGMDEDTTNAVFPVLLPRMCLNRYYVAEGVRLYSQETWRMVMGDRGRTAVAACASSVVDYYIEASQANNHAVREAACACMAELMNKVEKAAVAPFVPRLLMALVDCFKDESWPVRDAACGACGKCVGAFPEESRVVLEELYALWFAHLWDNIWSVRETTAVALGEVLRVYGDEAWARLMPVLKERLPQALVQPRESTKNGALQNVSTFGVVMPKASKAASDVLPPPMDDAPGMPAARIPEESDQSRFENQTMFSCGSLGPKLRRGGGCMDHGFTREKEPWEASDGALYMLREVAAVRPNDVAPFLPQVLELSRLTQQSSFRHCNNLLETLWKQLPLIAKNMGKKTFKPHLDEFIDPMFRTTRCGHPLAEMAAINCVRSFQQMLGETIFAGRLNESQLRQLQENPEFAGRGSAGRDPWALPDKHAPQAATSQGEHLLFRAGR